ncbi:hypothetical protein ACLKA6_010632 [Drosophila palustris]
MSTAYSSQHCGCVAPTKAMEMTDDVKEFINIARWTDDNDNETPNENMNASADVGTTSEAKAAYTEAPLSKFSSSKVSGSSGSTAY